MASADFSASSFRRYRRPWPFRADGEISRNKTHFFRPAGCGFTTLLRLGLGLRLVLQTCPQVGLVSAFCAYPPNFASDFLHPRPRGRKLVLGYLVPPNWPIGDFHSRPCVMSCVQTKGNLRVGDCPFAFRREPNYWASKLRLPITLKKVPDSDFLKVASPFLTSATTLRAAVASPTAFSVSPATI